MPVIALLAPKVDDTEDQVCMLSDIDYIPEEVLWHGIDKLKRIGKTAG